MEEKLSVTQMDKKVKWNKDTWFTSMKKEIVAAKYPYAWFYFHE